MKKLILNITAIIALSMSVSSCSDWLTIMPRTEMPATEMFQTEGGFNDALVGAYINIAQRYSIDNMSGFIEHLACQWDGYDQTSNEASWNIHDYNNDHTNSALERLFQDSYKCIADINIILANIDNGVVKREKYNQLKGELLALRAFLHFDLIRMWGPVPTVDRGSKYLPYNTVIQVEPYQYLPYKNYMQMLLDDVTVAEELLKPTSAQSSDQTRSAYFMNYYGAVALHSRVALWMNNTDDAIKYATIIYEDEYYSLGDINSINSGDLLMKSEHIFANSRAMNITEFLTDKSIFESVFYDQIFANANTDIRLNLWERTVNKDDEALNTMNCTKYNVAKSDDSDKEKKQEVTVPLIRLSEIYFTLIECLDIPKANVIYEKFCASRRIAYTPFVDDAGRQDVLMKEWSKEFIAEGQLFYYHKRKNTKYMPRCSRTCDASAYVLPIPKGEIEY